MSIRLSILIPAYGYPEGVERILSALRIDSIDEIEILISDDSQDDAVSQLVAEFSLHYRGNLRYLKNSPSLGAIANWNSLLELAAGDYVLLLHHDECPLDEKFASRALSLLRIASEIDVFVMKCILRSFRGTFVRPHLPTWIRILVLKYFPAYLFKRNVLGPASCLIVRRALYPRFDERLRWLVDVDSYYRLRLLTRKWRFCEELRISSTVGRKDSITASVKDDLQNLDAQERLYLSQKYSYVSIWLTPKLHSVLITFETFAWALMRAITVFYYYLIYCLSVAINFIFRFRKK